MKLPTIPLLSLGFALTLLTPLTAAAGELQIDRTHSTDCTRRTTSGDTISMHYRGTLASDGNEFDSSYRRNAPITFVLGSGRVIKGYVTFLQLCLPCCLWRKGVPRLRVIC